VQTLIAGESLSLLAGELKGALQRACAVTGDMWREQKVRRAPERVLGWKRFGVNDIDCGANALLLERFEKSVGVDGCAASGIDKESAALQLCEALRIEVMTGLRGEWHDEYNDISESEQIVEPSDRLDTWACSAGNAQECWAE
jgi:hypothetical protein